MLCRCLFNNLNHSFKHFSAVRTYCLKTSRLIGIEFNYNFSTEEQKKILNTLNQSSAEQLLRYNVSRGCIKSLEHWKNKKGHFKNLNEILEVDGLGERILKQLCDRIVADDLVEESIKVSSNPKKNKQFVTQQISESTINNIQHVVGIHLGPTGISWAKISRRDNKLCNWNYKVFTSLPNKLLLTETFDLAINTLQKIPPGDLYIFEANSSSAPGKAQAANMSSYTQHLELLSMLFALINTSQIHNITLSTENESNSKTIENKVFQVKSKVPARLFKTLVGNEKVSALKSITGLVNGDSNCTVPCTPILVEPVLRQYYNGQNSINKELLGQALMLVVSFMDLCVYKNQSSINALGPGKRK